MIIDQLLLAVLVIVTLAVVYMLYRFYKLTQQNTAGIVTKKSERAKPEKEDVSHEVP